ncbi:Flp family type IVb pilin [Aminobacterium sp. EBM-42]|uniref:Flp family type IVb pilin n=1 Tax=Aminobacterium sp. EBM-42 TaxID=1918503 RepID=UPI000ADB078B|nr:Flp family type IVb pilin [Aminobacterium sp. EBM-42]
MLKRLRNLVTDEEGQGLVEYALIIGAIAIGAFVILSGIGTKILALFTAVETELPSP